MVGRGEAPPGKEPVTFSREPPHAFSCWEKMFTIADSLRLKRQCSPEHRHCSNLQRSHAVTISMTE